MEAIPFTGEQLTLSGLLATCILAIIFGFLVPRYFYTEAKERIKEERAEKHKALDSNAILQKALLEALKVKDKDPATVRALEEEAGT